jgi:hypothetical protein
MKRLLEILLLGLVVAAAFGAVIPEYFLATDDLWSTQVTSEVARNMDGLGDGLYRMVFQAEGHGHFRPFQDAGYIIAYDALGWRKWMRALAFFYLLLHIGSCALIAHLLRRVGLAPALAFLAAALFAVHPALDTNLASVQYGNNVPAFFFVLLAAAVSFPNPDQSRRKAVARMLLGGVLLYIAVGYAINVAMSAPVLLGLLGFAGGFRLQREHITRLVIRALTLVAGLGAALGHRYLAYGTLKSKIPSYTKMEPDHDLAKFADQFYQSAVELRPDALTRYLTRLSPPGSGQYADIFRADFLSDDLVYGLGALVLCVLGAALLAPKRRSTPESGEAAAPQPAPHPLRGFLPATLLGLGLTTTHLLPYFWEIGRCDLNRYNQPAMSGLAILIVLVAGLAALVFAPRGTPRLRGTIAAMLIALPFMVWFGTARESSRSIIHGHRSVRAIVDTILPALEAEPEIRRFYLAGHPRMVGRAGLGNTTQNKLENLAEVVLDRGWRFKKTPDVSEVGREGVEPHWFAALGPNDPLPPHTALWQASANGLLIERIQHGSQLGPTGRGEQLLLEGRSRGWGKDKGAKKALMSRDPNEVAAVLKFVSEVEGGRRNILGLDALLEVRGDCAAPRDKELPRPRAVATAENRRLALSLLMEKRRNDTAKVGAEAIETYPQDPEIASLLLELSKHNAAKDRNADLAFALAVHGPESLRASAIDEVRRHTGGDSKKIATAVASIRQGLSEIESRATAEAGADKLNRAAKILRELGRPSTVWAVPGARALIAAGDAATREKLLPNWTKWSKRPLGEEIAQWEERESLEDALELGLFAFAPDRQTKRRTVAVTVANRSDRAIATGYAFCALRLAWTLLDADGAPLAQGRLRTPEGGLNPGRARHLYFELPPEIPSGSRLRVEPLEYAGDAISLDL